ncbi:MAG TPA: aldehyde dehydrogenase family protein, partial [Acidimicrobiales bacterium]
MSATTSDAPFLLWIGGEGVKGSDGTYEIVNPATEEVVALAPEASAADAEDAAAAAAAAFPAWSQTTPEQRAALLDKAADLFTQRFAELVPLAQAETGATTTMTQMANV